MQSFKDNIPFDASLFFMFPFNYYLTAPLLAFDHTDWAASPSK